MIDQIKEEQINQMKGGKIALVTETRMAADIEDNKQGRKKVPSKAILCGI